MTRRNPWHLCGTCYFIDKREMCNYYPDQAETHPERWGCNFWACVGCYGAWDEGQEHDGCLHGVIFVV